MIIAPTTAIEKPNNVGNWPFMVDIFDRNPVLTSDEIEALVSWHAHWKTPNTHSLQTAERLLTRLTQPIDQIFTCYGNDTRTKRSARSFLLNEMHKRKTSFWAWGEQEWTECIGHTYDEFRAYHVHRSQNVRNYIMACAYLVCEAPIIQNITDYQQKVFATRMFGSEKLVNSLNIVGDEMIRLGYRPTLIHSNIFILLSELLLINRSPNLNDIASESIHQLILKYNDKKKLLQCCGTLSVALHNLKIIANPVSVRVFYSPKNKLGVNDTLPEEWFAWINRWHQYSTASIKTRNSKRTALGKAGRWAYGRFGYTSPTQWTVETCIEYVSDINKMVIGEWMHPLSTMLDYKKGKPLSANAKAHLIQNIRTFFLDCQEWELLPIKFNPHRYLEIPKSIQNLRQPAPRVIQDDIWAKLLIAGLQLEVSDLPVNSHLYSSNSLIEKEPFYPLELVRSIVLVWLFAGLRSDEIYRLRLGCIQWRDANETKAEKILDKKSVCLLHVPINKTGDEFNKPVDYIVGEAVEMWEKVRPSTQTHWDSKASESVNFLFVWRGKRVGRKYINETVIPMLCKKAGLPTSDARGNITSHRARSTIATQLFNAREPLSFFDLQQWLGHKSPKSTAHYVRANPTKLSAAYTNAEYFSRNMRLVEVLIDKENAKGNSKSKNDTTLYYDLVHGFCTFDYFAKCPHRMACAKCSYYIPKESERANILEAKTNLLHMQQFMPVSDLEILVIEKDLTALKELEEQLQDVPTPQGLTPRELEESAKKLKKPIKKEAKK